MKKLFFLMLLLPWDIRPFPLSAEQVTDRYGGWYSVAPDTAPYGLSYRFYKEPGHTGVNRFEYLSIMDTIYDIWGATEALSECDRWRAVNVILETRVDPYINYPAGVYRSSIPWDSNSVVYYSTHEAVLLGFISTSTVNYGVKFSTIPICREGEKLSFK